MASACVAVATLAALGAVNLEGADKRLRQRGGTFSVDVGGDGYRPELACTSCLAVAWELGALLSADKGGDVLVAGSLKGKKKKQGYLASEARTTELMEKVCKLMNGYGLYRRDSDGVSVYRQLVQHKGVDSLPDHTARLGLFCDRLIEEREEEVEKIIRLGTGIGAGDMEALAQSLCVEIAHHCRTEAQVVDMLPYTDAYQELLLDFNMRLRKEQKAQKALKKKAERERERAGKQHHDEDE